MTECKGCQGTGKCSKCNGGGRQGLISNCSRCSGTGKCTVCDGKGRV